MAFRKLDKYLILSYYYKFLHYWTLNRPVAFKKETFFQTQATAMIPTKDWSIDKLWYHITMRISNNFIKWMKWVIILKV